MKYYLTVQVNGKIGYWKDIHRTEQTLKFEEAAKWTRKQMKALEEAGYCKSSCCGQEFIPIPDELKVYKPSRRKIKI